MFVKMGQSGAGRVFAGTYLSPGTGSWYLVFYCIHPAGDESAPRGEERKPKANTCDMPGLSHIAPHHQVGWWS